VLHYLEKRKIPSFPHLQHKACTISLKATVCP
jgi:hypothetical protein